jgi:hypothetical protein
MVFVQERPADAAARPRPRFSTTIEPLPLRLPSDKALGPAIASTRAPNGDLYLLHHGQVEPDDTRAYLPHVLHFSPELEFIDAWGGPDWAPVVDGVSQWPSGPEGLECDQDGDLWIFGYQPGDSAVLKFSPSGEFRFRLGQRGRIGNDGDTRLLGSGATSCLHDVQAREVFVADGYSNHRVIAFSSDTGEFTRMWGAYGKPPASLSEAESFGNPVHKVARGPNGRLYVADRIKCRVQEFELTPGGARYLREAWVAPGTQQFGAAFDLAFPPDERFMYVADGINQRVWTIELDGLTVLGWASAQYASEGEDNLPAFHSLLHRFSIEPNGDLLLACTKAGFRRMSYLGVS